MIKQITRPTILLPVITACIILLFFGKFIFHANAYLLTQEGDGFKNYYTPAWYIKYDEGVHFTGMNYPYGEHVVFTDDQPIIAGLLNFIDDHIFTISGYTIGILNLMLFLSLFGSVWLMYRILLYYRLPPWFAFFGALLIGFGAPQIGRFTGHYALGYTLFFPLLWWLCIRLFRRRSGWWVTITGAITVLVFSFIHVYYLFIALLFIVAVVVVLLLKKYPFRRHYLQILLIAILPVICFMLLMRSTDPVSDRPESPYGFFTYKATFQSVFLAPEGDLKRWLEKNIGLRSSDFEGIAYVGIVGLIILFVSVILFVRRLAKKGSIAKAWIPLPGNLGVFFCASILLLAFSMALPFSTGLEWMLDVIPFIKQFRSPGRFAWVFYYVYTVYGAVLIYYIYKSLEKKQSGLAYVIVGAAVFFQGRDVMHFLTSTRNYANHTTGVNPFTEKNNFYAGLLKDAGISTKNYQAILFVPAFFQGSEKLYIDRSGGEFRHAMAMSYQTGLPLINQMMSRTSLSQTLHVASLTGHPALKKSLPDGMDERPILLVASNQQFTKGETDLINKSRLLTTYHQFRFLELDTKVFEQQQEFYTDYMTSDRSSLCSFDGGSYFSLDTNYIFYRNSFEDMTSPDPFMGKGSYYFHTAGKTLINEIPIDIKSNNWVEVSYWAKAYHTTTAFPHLKVELVGANNQVFTEYSVTAKLSADILGQWVRGSENYELWPDVKRLRVYITEASEVNIDELVVRHTAFDMFYDMKNDSTFIYNNFPIGLYSR